MFKPQFPVTAGADLGEQKGVIPFTQRHTAAAEGLWGVRACPHGGTTGSEGESFKHLHFALPCLLSPWRSDWGGDGELFKVAFPGLLPWWESEGEAVPPTPSTNGMVRGQLMN